MRTTNSLYPLAICLFVCLLLLLLLFCLCVVVVFFCCFFFFWGVAHSSLAFDLVTRRDLAY